MQSSLGTTSLQLESARLGREGYKERTVEREAGIGSAADDDEVVGDGAKGWVEVDRSPLAEQKEGYHYGER